MLIGRFAIDPAGLELEGDVVGLLDLSHALTCDRQTRAIQLSTIQPPPYDRCLTAILITKISDDAACLNISRIASEMHITGPGRKLAVLAKNIKFLISQTVEPTSTIQEHIHIEWYQDHPLLSPTSIPLTIDFRTSDAP